MSTAPVAPRRARRWTVVACFAAANAAAWVGWDRLYAARHRGTLHVSSVDPGDGSAVGRDAVVRWHFDADVIPTDAYAKPPGTVAPPVAGRWAWESPRTLAFVPATGLPRAVPVAFTLSPDLIRTGTGGRLDQPVVTHVRPDPLVVSAVRQSGVIDGCYVLELAFSDRVNPGDVLAHLTVKGPDGKPVHCTLAGQAAGPIVRVRTEPMPADTDGGELAVQLAPGLIGAAGPLGLAEAYDAAIPLARSLTVTALTPFAPTRGQPYLQLSLSDEADLADLKRVLTLDPPVPFTLTKVDYNDGIRLTGDLQSGTRYTLRVGKPPADTTAADRHRFPRPGVLAAFVPDVGRDCWMDADQGYLSTAGHRALTAHVVNVDAVRVTVTRVYDDNLVAWRNAPIYRSGSDTESYARPAAERNIQCPGKRNARRDVPIRLDDLLPPALARSGVWRVAVAPAKGGVDDANGGTDRYYSGGRDAAVVTLSDIGLTAKRTRGGVLAWATSLRSAMPLAGVRVRAYSDKNQPLGSATTDRDGLARIDGITCAPGEAVAVLLADTAAPSTTQPATAELTWLDFRGGKWDLADADTGGRPYLRSGHSAFAYADRGVYRPGETVHLRAIVRGPGDVAPKQAFPVRWRFRRPDGRDWRIVPAFLDDDGNATADVPLPADLPTGTWSADVGLSGDDAQPFGAATFAVEEFVPNRLKVAMKVGDGPRCDATDSVPVDVQADYLFGRPAAGLNLETTARATPVPFAPAAWAGWTFGDAADVRRPTVATTRTKRRARKPTAPSSSDTADTLDDAGHHHGTVDVADLVHADAPGGYRGPWRLTVEASVAEAGGRAVTAARQVDVDAVPAYVGVRRAGDAARPGEPCAVQLQRVRPDGTAVAEAADVSVRLLRENWNVVTVWRDDRYQYDCTRTFDPVAADTVHLEGGTGTWAPTPPARGRYVIEATDADGGAVTTSAFYAADESGWDETVDQTHPDRLDVRVLGPGEPDVPAADARTKAAAPPQRIGSTARVLVAAPFAGRLLLTVETDAVVQQRVIDMPASHVVVPVDVSAACAPGAFVTATVIRPIDPDAPWKPHRAFGVGRLNVDPVDRKLVVALDGPTVLRPMTSLDVGLTVTTPDGRPAANAAVAVAAVDEGICTVTGFATPDPLAFFTAKRALGVDSADVFNLLMPESTARPAVGGDGADEKVAPAGRHTTPVTAHRVRPVALPWVTVHTDDAGHATASFPVPPFQGQLRVMAVANTADRVGSGQRAVTVRSPLLAQTSWPRFAAPGDGFTVPVVLFNNRPIDGSATVTVESTDAADLLTLPPQVPAVTLSANGQGRVDLPVRVADKVGVAHVRLTATMAGESYSEDLELPIRPAAPFSQFGGMARATVGGITTVAPSVPLLPGTASLHVGVTPWPTLNLPNGLEYLDRYPYGCVEQTTSTLFPLVALGDIGRRLDPDRFDPERIKVKVDVGITRLLAMQTADGGLSMWPGETDAWRWGSVYAAHFLTVAKRDGYDVPDDFYTRLLGYVRRQLDVGTDAADGLEAQAYAAYVLALAGRPERSAMNRLGELATAAARPDDPADGYAMRGDAQLFLSVAWLLSGRRELAEDLLPATAPAPRANRQHDGNVGSGVRDRALLVLALEQVQPDRADLPQLVQQLADLGSENRWASTQDVAFATLAVGQYLQGQTGHAAYDAATLSLGTQVLAAADHGGTLSYTTDAPGDAPLQVQLTGPAGAIGHVSWLASGVPLAPPPAASHGLTLHRRYLTRDGTDVRGRVRSGDLVRVEVDLDGPGELTNVVLDDLLPAGLEVENARLATAAHDAGDVAAVGTPPAFGGGMVDVRDDRVVIVGRVPFGGHARATYLARAVTPGTFVAPPPRAEAMYDLNLNGTGDTGRLVVVAASGRSDVVTAGQ